MDTFSKRKRSWVMGRIKHKDTQPEKIIRSLIHQMGYRFRLHQPELPGKPDIVLPKYRKIILVNGCFWHGHKNCSRAKLPKSNNIFWLKKIEGNKNRDKNNIAALKNLGWDVLVIWQCEIKNQIEIQQRLRKFISDFKSEKAE